MGAGVKRGRGRPAVYLDQADRQAAYRERQADAAALAAAARAMVERPTPAFVRLVMARLIDQAEDPAAMRRMLADQLAAANT